MYISPIISYALGKEEGQGTGSREGAVCGGCSASHMLTQTVASSATAR